MIYLRARWYDPATGQFMSVDPLVAQTQQSYEYAGNNPVNYTDPFGRLFGIPDPVTALAATIGGVVGGASGAIGYGAGVISGDHSFSVSGLVGATVGGAVGGAIAGGCVEATDAVGLAVCGAAAGAASTAVNNVITGQNVSSGISTGIALGAVGNVLAGSLVRIPENQFLPYKLSNLFNPGINAQRLYARAGFAGLVGAFSAAAQGTPAYADAFGTSGLCGLG